MSKLSQNTLESLAILYLQNQDLSGKSPEELYQLYSETYDKFKSINDKLNPARLAEVEKISPEEIRHIR